jgi:hypothetical protein
MQQMKESNKKAETAIKYRELTQLKVESTWLTQSYKNFLSLYWAITM